MSSILTNNSAMVALQTLKSINMGLEKTQSQISTGKDVANAADNSAVWAISKVMESDVSGFKAISDSLSLGKSTVAVARNAAETVTDLLTDMKGKIVAAQEDNVDRTKIQEDVAALRDQITSVVSAAQFNGLNLVDGSAGASIDILSSLDRSSSGVTPRNISVTTQDLGSGTYTASNAFEGTSGESANFDSFGFFADSSGGSLAVTIDDTNLAAGDAVSLNVGGNEVSYTLTASDVAGSNTADVVGSALASAVDASESSLSATFDGSGVLTITNNRATDISITGQFHDGSAGGLGALASLSVATSGDAATALGNIETFITSAIDAAASFGSSEGRITTQSEFISSLTDSFTSGIGSLVDADMEETSAKLQALQVQQQLGVQSLSIANQSPQSILSLFR